MDVAQNGTIKTPSCLLFVEPKAVRAKRNDETFSILFSILSIGIIYNDVCVSSCAQIHLSSHNFQLQTQKTVDRVPHIQRLEKSTSSFPMKLETIKPLNLNI